MRPPTIALILLALSGAAAAAPPAPPGNCTAPPSMSKTMPTDMSPNSQANANCFAWQQFIVLNWLADATTCAPDANAPASAYGTPDNTDPVAWETYKEASEVFRQGGAAPSPWCAQQPMLARLRGALKGAKPAPTSAHGYKSLASVSKAGANPVLSEFGQAGTGNAWLTAQNGNMALYEVRLNQDEFNFIKQNKLYDASKQAAFAQNPGFNLPDGTASFTQYGSVGAVEVKASWVELPDPATWANFKTSKAWVVYPSAPTSPKLVTVGLTGLHIIHKTKRSPQFVWATFEHVNNAPSTSDLAANTLLPWYTFYNKNCDPASDHYHCYPNAQPPGTLPTSPYFPQPTTDPYNAPVQVVRENPISNNSTDDVAGLNNWVWQYVIGAANPNSVFKNYQLVDVLWANAPVVMGPGATAPLPDGNPQPDPSTRIVANTTMETYFQSTKNCLFCHKHAAIAAASAPAGKRGLRNQLGATATDKLRRLLQAGSGGALLKADAPQYASDYSFLFGDAQAPAPLKRAAKKKAAP